MRPSRQHPRDGPTTRWLIRFGYVGWNFAGWARQPGFRTVEGEVRRGLVRSGLAPSEAAIELAVASRTDRGVSARGNALTLVSPLDGTALLRALNGLGPDLFFTHASAVPPTFRVRHAEERWYRYFVVGASSDRARWVEGARLFRGPIDVRSFGRGIPAGRPVLRELREVRVTTHSDGLQIDVVGRSFVWGMVRKMVAALRALADGALDAAQLRQAIAGRRRLTLPLAEPEGLVLWDVRYPVKWDFEAPAHILRSRRHLLEDRRQLATRSNVVESLLESMGREPSPESIP